MTEIMFAPKSFFAEVVLRTRIVDHVGLMKPIDASEVGFFAPSFQANTPPSKTTSAMKTTLHDHNPPKPPFSSSLFQYQSGADRSSIATST